MFLARMVFFRLHESPRYLVHAGRHQEALESLQLISRFNGSELPLELEDVDDRLPSISEAHAPCTADERVPILPTSSSQDTRTNGETLIDAGADSGSVSSDQSGTKVYQSMDGATHDALDGHSFITPVADVPARGQSLARGDYSVHSASASASLDDSDSETKNLFPTPEPRPQTRQRSPHARRASVVSIEMKQRVGSVLPRWVRRPLLAWLDRVGMVLSPEWFRVTILVWGVWFFMSLGNVVSSSCVPPVAHWGVLAYTMFNVYLPKLLETGSSDETSTKSLEDSLWDVLIFTLGGCPGAIVCCFINLFHVFTDWRL